MKRFKIRYDGLLFGLLMAFLLASIVQKWTNVFPIKPLKGVFEPTKKAELSFDNYRTGTYQVEMEKYVSENFGFREPVIRVYNQYLWSAFNKTYCHFIVPGKQGWLYYMQAVNEYYGKELSNHYPSNEAAMKDVDIELRRMNKLRHVLKDYGIEVLAFVAPDKPEVYPEYLPRCDADTTSIHISEYFTRRMAETGFPCVNMTDWFVSMKDTVQFPLFPKTDSHWRYSAIYGFDSLFRFINTLGGEAKFPPIHIGAPVAYESDALEGDEETLNLIFRIRGDKTKYKSEITVEPDTLHRKPKVLFVGDSFIWSMETFMPIRELMANKEIWFYNNTAFMGFDKNTASVGEINRLSHILNADYVVLYSAGHQWREITYGFAKDALLQLCVSDSLFEAAVEDYTQRMSQFESYASMTEEEVRGNMVWMLRNDPELIPGLDGEAMPTIRNTERIERAMTINRIKEDADWLLSLRIYAAQHDITFDSALETEAINLNLGQPLLREGIVPDTASFVQMKKYEMIQRWKHNPQQMQLLEKKAKRKGLPIEVILEQDAQWVIDKQMVNGALFK